VTTQELLAILNADAAGLGMPPVDALMLRFWIDGDLIEARTPQGRRRGVNPTWQFSESATHHARAIVDLKSRGVQRATSLQIHLWVIHDNYSTEAIRKALRAEFVRLLNRQRRASRFNYDHRNRKAPLDVEVQKHAKKLPPLDSDLRADGFEFFNSEMLVGLTSELMWGESSGEKLAGASRKLAELAGLPFNSEISLENLGGLFGNLEEISGSGEETLKLVSHDDLHEARRRFKEVQAFYELSAQRYPGVESLRKTRRSLTTTDWIVSFLAMFAVQAFRERSQK
jgi:hypothetical protein